MLVKYQEKMSVNLNETEELVDSFVKNKYEDLFGDEENVGSGSESIEAPLYAANNLYPVFESDATRKYVSCKDIDILNQSLYYKNTLISDSRYNFLINNESKTIVYQRQYCGSEGVCSFIISTAIANNKSSIIQIGNISINIEQNNLTSKLYINKLPNMFIELENTKTYFIIFRWSQVLNYVDFTAFNYVRNEKIPSYKLNGSHFWFDMDNPHKQNISKFDIELIQEKKCDVLMNSFSGWITNIKLFDVYNDNISEILQMYPTHQHLIINDTARKLVDLKGVELH
jgi:hypothetical protein